MVNGWSWKSCWKGLKDPVEIDRSSGLDGGEMDDEFIVPELNPHSPSQLLRSVLLLCDVGLKILSRQCS